MVADAARAFKPKILYPYHYGETNQDLLVDLLKDLKGRNPDPEHALGSCSRQQWRRHFTFQPDSAILWQSGPLNRKGGQAVDGYRVPG